MLISWNWEFQEYIFYNEYDVTTFNSGRLADRKLLSLLIIRVALLRWPYERQVRYNLCQLIECQNFI